jgi:hypothetical protein
MIRTERVASYFDDDGTGEGSSNQNTEIDDERSRSTRVSSSQLRRTSEMGSGAIPIKSVIHERTSKTERYDGGRDQLEALKRR